jgi:predicted acyl esterase
MTIQISKKNLYASLLSVLLFASISIAQAPAPATGTYSVITQPGVRVKMRDGVLLAADIYRPQAEGKFPVILTRTPYNRKDPTTGNFLASHGYVVIQQDTRGRLIRGASSIRSSMR